MPIIYIIDDDQITLDLLEGVLSSEYEVHTFLTAKEAIKKFKQLPSDLVITDMLMPETDGLETIYEFRRLNLWLPMIAISADPIFKDGHFRKVAERIGADDFLLKPIDADKLHLTIKEVLARNEKQ